MSWDRVELKRDSRGLLKLNYWPFVLVAVIHAMVTGEGIGTGGGRSARTVYRDDDSVLSGITSGDLDLGLLLAFVGTVIVIVLSVTAAVIALDIFVLNPIEVGCKRYMTLARSQKPELGEMVFAFKNCYSNIVKTMFFMDLYTFLWTLLFIIPGIVKAYEYRMIPYLMAEFPDMDSRDAFRISREMMDGNKWNAFVLDLSFIGWRLLGALTVVVDIFFVNPYVMLTDAGLYLALKQGHPAISSVQKTDNIWI